MQEKKDCWCDMKGGGWRGGAKRERGWIWYHRRRVSDIIYEDTRERGDEGGGEGGGGGWGSYHRSDDLRGWVK